MKNWYIEITEENESELLEWWNDNVSNDCRPPCVGEYLMSKNPKDNSCFWSKIDTDNHGLNWQQQYELITLEQFREITNSNKMKHPEKWYIVATKENFNELNAWRKTVAESCHSGFSIDNLLLSKHLGDDSYYYGASVDRFKSDSDYNDYQEITLEQFRQITGSKSMNTHPKKWYIVATEDNYDELNAWRQTVATSYLDSFRIGHPLLSYHPMEIVNSYYYGGSVDSLRRNSDFNGYQEITIEQFRAITNPKPMSKTEVKTIQISRTLLNEYYDAATTPQKEYLTEHFKLDGTTTDEAIRGLYELACGGWKPKIKANHPDCFPEDSKYFDFSKHTNQYGYDSIVSSDVAHSLGLCKDFIQVKAGGKYSDRSFYLTSGYNWELVNEGGAMILIPTKKVK